MLLRIACATPGTPASRQARTASRTALLASLAVVLSACGSGAETSGATASGAENGRLLLRQFGCGRCHEIPGVADAKGRIGPPLGDVGRRIYLAGRLPNTPQNMVRFIREPQAVKPGTAMPDLGVSEPHARDMVAYLRTLRK